MFCRTEARRGKVDTFLKSSTHGGENMPHAVSRNLGCVAINVGLMLVYDIFLRFFSVLCGTLRRGSSRQRTRATPATSCRFHSRQTTGHSYQGRATHQQK